MKFRGLSVATAVALVLSACASRGPAGPLQTASGPSSNVRLVSEAEFGPPSAADQFNSYRPFQIGPFDVLQIGVFGIEGLEQREYRTDGSGRISFPLVGVVAAGGLTPEELGAELAQRLRANHVRNPQVSVNLKDATSRMVTVGGQVTKPGSYPVLGKMTLMRAVAEAGGMGDFAKTNEVIVFRTVKGRQMAAIYNLSAIQRGNYDDPEIYANDVIVVGDSPQKRAVRDLIGALPAIVAPLIVTLLRN